MDDIDPRLTAALDAQLATWHAALCHGAARVGWKLGVGESERIGPGPVIGHLTTATQLVSGSTYVPDRPVALHADAEVAVAMSADVDARAGRTRIRAAIAGYGAALEIVDLATAEDSPEAIVAANVFHRAFALRAVVRETLPRHATARIMLDGATTAHAPITRNHVELVHAVAVILDAMGLRLERGDRLITGSAVQVAVAPGEAVTADLGPLGCVELSIGPARDS
jgi:hypothetical protein